jgi:hypothetical protein
MRRRFPSLSRLDIVATEYATQKRSMNMKTWKITFLMFFISILTLSFALAIACGDDDDDDDDGDDDTADIELEDPCEGLDEPGEYECDGCPDIELPEDYEFDLEFSDADVTTFQFTSTETGPVTGHDGDGVWYLERLGSRTGLNGGDIFTDEIGDFEITIPIFCKNQLLKTSWSNADGRYCLVHAIQNTNCNEGDIRVTLSWGAGANDLELHLIRDGGQINNHDGGNDDCTWTNMNPDWGEEGNPDDDPLKDVDWTVENGVENIYLSNPENIVYHVLVEYWGTGVPTMASLVLNVNEETTVFKLDDFTSHQVWYAATIDWSNRSVEYVNEVVDCSGDWSSGCLMDLP